MDGLYDEFGNYIGGGLDSDDDDDDLSVGVAADNMQLVEAVEEHQFIAPPPGLFPHNEGALVLHEDKKYYQDAEEIYPTAKTVTFNEDAMDISEPIIKPVKPSAAAIAEAAAASTSSFSVFHKSMMDMPLLTRHISVIGHIHHGKTSLISELLASAIRDDKLSEEDSATPVAGAGDVQGAERRRMMPRKDEQAREISIKSNLSSALLSTRAGKTYLMNLLDNPGHSNFHDESRCSLMVSDGALVVVDAIEGVMLGTDVLVRAAVAAQNSICLVINKVDRLILELKLPPQDAYFKLLHIVEEFSTVLAAAYDAAGTEPERLRRVSPELGNVCFASTRHGWSFTLESFAAVYTSQQQQQQRRQKPGMQSAGVVSEAAMAKRLWGDWWFDSSAGPTGALTRNRPPGDSAPRSFVQFILEPLYKVYSHVLGSVDDNALMAFLRSLQLRISREEVCSTTRPMEPSQLLRIVLSRFFGNRSDGLVDMLVRHVPSPLGDAATRKLRTFFAGHLGSPQALAIAACSSDAPLVVHVAKLYVAPGADADTDSSQRFLALARVYSGKISAGSRVRVLGEAFSAEDDEDSAEAEVAAVLCGLDLGARAVELPGSVSAGSLVLLRGVDASIKKTATIVSPQLEECAIFRPVQLGGASVMKVAVEPLKPSQLPKMVEAVRCVCKSYPLLQSKVEGSGEHCLMGPGELYFDCALADLRTLFSDIEIKTSDPVVVFCETVVDASSIKCTAETPNKQNRFSVVAEPLDDGLAVDIEAGRVAVPSSLAGGDKKNMEAFFQNKYGWDLLAVHSIWAFGLDAASTNVLLDDTIGGGKEHLKAVKNSVVQGFRWGCKEGPLCDEAVRNVKFKILSADVSSQPIMRAGGQVIPTARRAIYSSFLTASPRIMEPIYRVDIQAPADTVQALYPVIQRRRGFVLEDVAKPGAPFYSLRAFVPVMDRCVVTLSPSFSSSHFRTTIVFFFCCSLFAALPATHLTPRPSIPPLQLHRQLRFRDRRSRLHPGPSIPAADLRPLGRSPWRPPRQKRAAASSRAQCLACPCEGFHGQDAPQKRAGR